MHAQEVSDTATFGCPDKFARNAFLDRTNSTEAYSSPIRRTGARPSLQLYCHPDSGSRLSQASQRCADCALSSCITFVHNRFITRLTNRSSDERFPVSLQVISLKLGTTMVNSNSIYACSCPYGYVRSSGQVTSCGASCTCYCWMQSRTMSKCKNNQLGVCNLHNIAAVNVVSRMP